MKAALFISILLAAPAAARAAERPAPPGAPQPAREALVPVQALFALVGGDYKKPEVLPEAFFNPFNVQATDESILQRKGGPVTNEAVDQAVDRRAVSGIVYAPRPASSQVIIGDQAFRIGDEVGFPEGEAGGTVPLLQGATVVLREITAERIGFDVTPDGDATRRVNYSLRPFWRP